MSWLAAAALAFAAATGTASTATIFKGELVSIPTRLGIGAAEAAIFKLR
jgi:hypothetical protein